MFSYSYLLSGSASHSTCTQQTCSNMPFFIDKNPFMPSWELYDYGICFVFFQELLLSNTSFIFTCIKKHKSKLKILKTSFMHNLVQITSIQKRIIDSFLIPCVFIEPLNLLNRLRKALLTVRKPAGMRWMMSDKLYYNSLQFSYPFSGGFSTA